MDANMDGMAWLQGRLERALGGRPLEEVLPFPRAVVGLEAAVAASLDWELARRAVDKLRAGCRLLPAEQEVLEVGIRLARPAWRLECGQLPYVPVPGVEGAARAALEALLPGVAWIGWRWNIPFATAFQVAPRVMATSAHVAQRLLQHGDDLRQGHFVACFEADAQRPERMIAIKAVLAFHPQEDVGFLELADEGPLEEGLPLAQAPQPQRGEPVLAVGYPLYNVGNPPFVDALFENVYGVKRLSPGELLGREDARLYHDCTTLPGSSGSPLVEPRTGRVIGIHASGLFAFRNTAVSTCAISTVPQLRSYVVAWK